jgi:hypothetical protein
VLHFGAVLTATSCQCRGEPNEPILATTAPIPGAYWTTVTVAVFEVTPPDVAVMLAFPIATAVTKPVDETVAVEVGTDVHVAIVVTFAVEPSP